MILQRAGHLATRLLWLTWPGLLLAQAPVAPDSGEQPLLPRYYVEVLVFSNAGGAAASTESFAPRPDPVAGPVEPASGAAPQPPEEPVAVYSDVPPALDGDPGAEEDAAQDEAEEEFRFELLEPDRLVLNEARDKLEKLSAYTPLFHGGWVQEGYPEERAKPFDISIIDSLAPLAGTVTFYKSRFLHVRVDLDYRPSAEFDSNRFTDRPWTGAAMGWSEIRYHIKEARRLRSGELHFFDHPAFGVLIHITPEPEPEPELELLPEPLVEGPAAAEPLG